MIKGKKVNLRALEKEDIQKTIKWINDPEVTKYLSIVFPISLAEEEKWFEYYLKRKDDRIFAIETKDGTHIGNIGLHKIDWLNRKVMLGILIGEKEYWNKGYGTDAVKTAVKFAFEEMNIHKVYLCVMDFNERAVKIYEKCGFTREGVSRDDVYRNGKYHDMIWMSVLNKGK